ncbi:MAG TPA: methyltransferase domain-containing protein [Chloroflexota bacterium]|nr:methyltransferase domain-containing protein [Chloroflexota bacterium]
MTGPARERWVRALRSAAADSFGPGEYVGQESFVTASEARELARAADIKAEDRVLDLCCGTGGLTCHVAEAIGCRILGVDRSPTAIRLARVAASAPHVRPRVGFLVADATRLPLAGPVDAALLFETTLAIKDKGALLTEIRRVLRPGARFGLTVEEGIPFDRAEREGLSHADAVWLIPEEAFAALCKVRGFRLVWQEDHTAQHAVVAEHLLDAYERQRAEVAERIGSDLCDRLIADHRGWVHWLTTRRVRKLVIVVEREV